MAREMVTAEVAYARDLTARIKHAAEGLWSLLLEARESECWRHMGYRSFSAYIEGEFDFNRAHAYRLVNQGKVIKELRSGLSPSGDTSEAIHITEAAARDIAPIVPEVIDRARHHVEHGAPPQVAVERAVSEVRAPIRHVATEDSFSDDVPVRNVAECEHEYACLKCGEVW